MTIARIFVMSLFAVIILSLGTNGIAAESSGVSHEIHCANSHELTHGDHGVEHNRNLESSDNVTSEAVQHDHETCMFHACPAMVAKEIDCSAESHLLFVRLQYLDPKLKPNERAENLLRPPRPQSA